MLRYLPTITVSKSKYSLGAKQTLLILLSRELRMMFGICTLLILIDVLFPTNIIQCEYSLLKHYSYNLHCYLSAIYQQDVRDIEQLEEDFFIVKVCEIGNNTHQCVL